MICGMSPRGGNLFIGRAVLRTGSILVYAKTGC